jgi:type IV secretory pathway VirD2 relaxase
MRRARLTRGGEVDFRLRRKAAWLKKLPNMVGRNAKPRRKMVPVIERMYGRRSTAKLSYIRNFRGRSWRGTPMREHARYMEQAHDPDPKHREPGFDAVRERVDISGEAHNWALARDRLHWRITLSPEDWERLNIREHTREVMAHMEKDLGTKLRWVAIEHTNTDHHHLHILLRGTRDTVDRNGKAVTLMIPQEYITRGVRAVSERLIEQQLGPRTEREYLQGRANGIEAERWTDIDRAIERKLEDGVADYAFARHLSERSRPRVQQEMERLAYLEGRGFARSVGPNAWEVDGDLKQRLKELQVENDLVRAKARERKQQWELERGVA